jgi:N-acetylneuraminic acid mutarotase
LRNNGKTVLVLVGLLVSLTCAAENEPEVVGQAGVYGTMGDADPANVPGSRWWAESWTDLSGNLWLFGGNGHDENGDIGLLNDLWRWDGENWTWMSGSSVCAQEGVYGTRGEPDPANVPGARCSAASWTDRSGNLWLFGGSGVDANRRAGALNDLWRWDGSDWTWVSGSDTVMQEGIYGHKGVADPPNVPGSRHGSVSWTDLTGNLWLFGGAGCDTDGNIGWLNDLWRWDGSSWTWIGGSDGLAESGVYGTKGTPDPANRPGARGAPVSWTDPAGNFWLFGGEGQAQEAASDSVNDIVRAFGYLNDLWRWDGTNWTWMSGSNWSFQISVHGEKGSRDAANVPGGRGAACSWTDLSGNLWLFGGLGCNGAGNGGLLNDLWKWDGAGWTWISGIDVFPGNELGQAGVYGVKGIPDPENVPGGRMGSVSWTDASGNLWLFGGTGVEENANMVGFNDLWMWDGANWTWISGSSY